MSRMAWRAGPNGFAAGLPYAAADAARCCGLRLRGADKEWSAAAAAAVVSGSVPCSRAACQPALELPAAGPLPPRAGGPDALLPKPTMLPLSAPDPLHSAAAPCARAAGGGGAMIGSGQGIRAWLQRLGLDAFADSFERARMTPAALPALHDQVRPANTLILLLTTGPMRPSFSLSAYVRA